MTSAASKIFNRLLSAFFVLSMFAAAMWTLSHCSWRATYFDGNATYIVQLDQQPLWSPPSLPAYEELLQRFPDMHGSQLPERAIQLVFEWDRIFLVFCLWLWFAAFVSAALSFIEPLSP